MRKLILLAALAAVALTGCFEEKPPMESHYTANGYEVKKLFTNDQCTLYKFYDNRTVYYADCKTSVTTDSQYGCGKGCVGNDNVITPKDQ
jgi:hypothetical protein